MSSRKTQGSGAAWVSTSLINFYLPEARTNVIRNPLVYCLSSEGPANQYHYWPGYQDSRKGQNALFKFEAMEYPEAIADLTKAAEINPNLPDVTTDFRRRV